MNPKINRWTGKPHEHKREIKRRVRALEIQARKKDVLSALRELSKSVEGE